MPNGNPANGGRKNRSLSGWRKRHKVVFICKLSMAKVTERNYFERMSESSLRLSVWLAIFVAWDVGRAPSLAAEKDNFAAARRRMVAEQLVAPGRDITNARVL